MNELILAGDVIEGPKFSHKAKDGVNIYKFTLSVMRKSGVADIFECYASERIIKYYQNEDKISIAGKIKSKHTYRSESGNRLSVFICVIRFYEFTEYENNVVIDGEVVVEPGIRITPLGRDISEFMIVNNKNILPCIAFDNTAKHIRREVQKNTTRTFAGRLQSRDYLKHYSNGTEEKRTVIELAIRKAF